MDKFELGQYLWQSLGSRLGFLIIGKKKSRFLRDGYSLLTGTLLNRCRRDWKNHPKCH